MFRSNACDIIDHYISTEISHILCSESHDHTVAANQQQDFRNFQDFGLTRSSFSSSVFLNSSTTLTGLKETIMMTPIHFHQLQIKDPTNQGLLQEKNLFEEILLDGGGTKKTETNRNLEIWLSSLSSSSSTKDVVSILDKPLPLRARALLSPPLPVYCQSRLARTKFLEKFSYVTLVDSLNIDSPHGTRADYESFTNFVANHASFRLPTDTPDLSPKAKKHLHHNLDFLGYRRILQQFSKKDTISLYLLPTHSENVFSVPFLACSSWDNEEIDIADYKSLIREQNWNRPSPRQAESEGIFCRSPSLENESTYSRPFSPLSYRSDFNHFYSWFCSGFPSYPSENPVIFHNAYHAIWAPTYQQQGYIQRNQMLSFPYIQNNHPSYVEASSRQSTFSDQKSSNEIKRNFSREKNRQAALKSRLKKRVDLEKAQKSLIVLECKTQEIRHIIHELQQVKNSINQKILKHKNCCQRNTILS